MDVWGWIAVYAVALTLVQFLLYRYLLKPDDSPVEGQTLLSANPDEFDYDRGRGYTTANERTRDRPNQPRSGDPSSAGVPPGGGRRCAHCGAENEPEETFNRCWNCANLL